VIFSLPKRPPFFRLVCVLVSRSSLSILFLSCVCAPPLARAALARENFRKFF
jgi:hypothetical protein